MSIAKVGNMRNQIGMVGPREVARCPKCGETYSANKGDYFMLADNDVLKCASGHRKVACRLVTPMPQVFVEQGEEYCGATYSQIQAQRNKQEMD